MELLSDVRFQATALVLIGLMTLPLALWVQTDRRAPDGPLIVLASPWHDPTPAIMAAGGALVAPERAPFRVFAASDVPQFAARLSALGYRSFQSRALSEVFCGVPS